MLRWTAVTQDGDLGGKDFPGWLAGLLALLMIFLTPSFLGHSLMNPKDIPFATGYIMSLFFTYRLLKFLKFHNLLVEMNSIKKLPLFHGMN